MEERKVFRGDIFFKNLVRKGKISSTTVCRQLVTKLAGQVPTRTVGNGSIDHLDTGWAGSFQSSPGNSNAARVEIH